MAKTRTKTKAPTKTKARTAKGAKASSKAAKKPATKSAKPKPPPTNLLEACQAGDVEAAKRFLAAGEKPDVVTAYGSTILSVVTQHDDSGELTRLLLEAGADPNANSSNYEGPPIWFAAYCGRDGVVRALLDRGARIDGAQGMDQHTILHCACAGGLRWLVEKALANGSDVAARTAQGHAPLHYAASNERAKTGEDATAIVRLLLDAGADVNYNNADTGWGTALHWAVGRGARIEVATLLLERGARIDAATNSGKQPIHEAAWAGHAAMVGLLIDRGADPNAATASGWTPMHFAAYAPSVDVVKLLKKRGGRVDAVSTDSHRMMSVQFAKKKTPRDVALRRDAKEVAALLR